jgi:hypothetical protein
MPRNRFTLLILAAAALVLVGASLAVADDNGGRKNIKRDRLSGYQEAPPVSTTGHGRFSAQLDRAANTIKWELSWADLTGTANAAHLHFGQRGVSAAVVVPLCAPCGAATGMTTGTITQASITAAQGLDTFAELVSAIRAGRIYVNIHTTAFPGGEIRAQLNNRNRR